ncbi:MAG TPA: tRNA (adenosine(37)-N6)-threonylcarbamoyltransferase complex dimerization subunit type 1 TsaB, partial [Candidatus Bathyarchaeia archaeon]|nr:tRNA (adenosine(37)-N6)-threonylcarbamoyltransferase complex dimerization subunit type 1 TsaB [Candidatus Bathyarchaeia archaeon]
SEIREGIMKLLSLDTSTKHFSLAITDGEKPLASRTMTNDRVLSSKIIPALEQLFVKASLKPEAIDGVAVGLGPGSFTSLRVGVSTAKALAYALNKPIVGIPSLDAAAMNVAKGKADQVCTFFDARRGLVYASVYQCLEQGLGLISDYLLTEPAKVFKLLKGTVAFVGDAIPLYRDVIMDKAKMKTARFTPVFLDEKQWYPSAKNLAALARLRFAAKDIDRCDTLVPLYLYLEDCQVRK